MGDFERQPLSKFRDVLVLVRARADDDLRRVVQIASAHPGFHELCVVDDDDRLLGVINIKKLFRTVFFHHADPNLMTRHLIELTSSETAEHLMITQPFVARETDLFEDAIHTMIRHDLGELPVVDEVSKVLGSVSIGLVLQLWQQQQNQRDAEGA